MTACQIQCCEVSDAAFKARDEVRELLGKHDMEHIDAPLNPSDGSITCLMIRGAALMRDCQMAHARACFEWAVLSSPLDIEANFNMGLFFEVTHQPTEMERWMQRVLRIHPNHYMAQVLLGKYKERVGQHGEAIKIYRRAMTCDPDPHLARGQIDQIVGDHKVCLHSLPAWPTAVGDILSETLEWRYAFPQWQENFLHPKPDLPGASMLEDGVCVWDDVLGEWLLAQLADCVDDMFQFVFTNFWINPGRNVTTCWLPRDKNKLESAAELAIRLLIPRFLGEDPQNFCGIEWWAKMRVESRGQGLHYDQSEADDPSCLCTVCGVEQYAEWVHGNPWRPRWSSVLFLTDEGGPTVIVEQIHTRSKRNDPRCPQRGFMVMPKRGRWVVFRGDLFHGSMLLNNFGTAPRKVMIFNIWRSHRPPPNHCDTIKYQRYPALRKIILTPEQIESTLAAETLRGREAEGGHPVPREKFSRASDMLHSTNFGCMNFHLPIPSAERLKAGTGFYEFDWRSAAEDYETTLGTNWLGGPPSQGGHGLHEPNRAQADRFASFSPIEAVSRACPIPCAFEIVD